MATYPDDATDTAGLIACADRRNYLAKARGRGVAVADDVESGTDTAPVSGRMWERDTAISAAHDFLTALETRRRGAFSVIGQPGAGHTRCLAEIGKIARMRGYDVVPLGRDAPSEPTPATDGSVLVIADVDAAGAVAGVVQRLTSRPDQPQTLGVVYARTGAPIDLGLPPLGSAELAPWSAGTLGIWLRTRLQGEPSSTLVSWLSSRSGGLPARAERELQRLRDRGDLELSEADEWTVTSSALRRTRGRMRLPVPVTDLVGREEERTRVIEMLARSRLVTLAGPGGVGKTRLSLAVAAEAADQFEGGAVFVPLAEITDADQMVTAIASAIGVETAPGQRVLDSVIEHLADTSLLLVLDNFEHVVSTARTVAELVTGAPGVTVLVTSRERLSVYGERVYQVPPLALPDLKALPSGPGGVARTLAESPALALFHQRAQAIDADFALTEATLPAAAALCHRLDGLPLAIELAAARSDQWGPQQLLDHLTGHLDALGDGPLDLPARQQTLRGAIDWSFVLLDPADQSLFTRLAVFAGGCTMDAVAAVIGGTDGESAPELAERLFALATKNLVVADVERGADDTTRYRMLETIRAYALERFGADPDADALRRSHAGHYAEFAERTAEELTGPEQAVWSERVEKDYLNLRAAFAATMDRGDVALAARFCVGLWRYWCNRIHFDEGRDWCARVLAAATELDTATEIELLYASAVIAAEQEDAEEARRLGETALKRAESVGDRAGVARAHNALGTAAILTGDHQSARQEYEHSLAIWRELDQPAGTAIALGNLAKLALRLGDITTASTFATDCLALERAAGNTQNIVMALECLVEILLVRGDAPEARRALEESMTLSRELGDVAGAAMAMHHMGLAAMLEGDRDEALRCFTDALGRRHEMGDRLDLAISLDSVAAATAEVDAEFAAELLGAADALRDRYGIPIPPTSDAYRQAAIDAVRSALGQERLAALRAAGQAAPLDLIVHRALDASTGTAVGTR